MPARQGAALGMELRGRPPIQPPPKKNTTDARRSVAAHLGFEDLKVEVTGSPFASVVTLKGTISGSAASVRAAAAGAVGLD